MFTRQKRNYRIFIYAALIVAICVLIALLLWPKEPEDVVTDNPSANPAINTNNEIDSNEEEPPVIDEEESAYGQTEETYYLVKKDGDSIKVFFSNKYGDLIELEETNILYDFLPVDDQSRFVEGVRVDTQEELSSLLMNYES